MARFGALVLPGQLANLPQGYGQRFPLFDENSQIATRQHMAKIATFIDLEELYADDAKIQIITQIFFGEVKTWLHAIEDNYIRNPTELTDSFLARWDEKKNPVQILAEYYSLRRNPNESVPEHNV